MLQVFSDKVVIQLKMPSCFQNSSVFLLLNLTIDFFKFDVDKSSKADPGDPNVKNIYTISGIIPIEQFYGFVSYAYTKNEYEAFSERPID